jgi:N-acyl-L-homoserine lactone synthetase
VVPLTAPSVRKGVVVVLIIKGVSASSHSRAIQTMFEDRKSLFVDLLGWSVPVIDARVEQDQYDHESAIYLIVPEKDGTHAGSMRLLPTTHAHILADLFSDLCEQAVPRGETIFEITRLCLPSRHGAAQRLLIRNRLISAMVDYALRHRIEALTGVVEASFLAKVVAMGWQCRPLGSPRRVNRRLLGAFQIDVTPEAPRLLAAHGIYMSATISADELSREAA